MLIINYRNKIWDWCRFGLPAALSFWVLFLWASGCFGQDQTPLRAWTNVDPVQEVDPSGGLDATKVRYYGVADGRQSLYYFEAKVDEIYDGDTFWAIVKIPSLPTKGNFKDWEYVRLKVRLSKCDTNEVKTTGRRFKGWTKEEKKEERRKGLETKKFAFDNWNNSRVTIVYRDKYFDSRWVCTVICPDGETMKSKLKRAGRLTGKYEN